MTVEAVEGHPFIGCVLDDHDRAVVQMCGVVVHAMDTSGDRCVQRYLRMGPHVHGQMHSAALICRIIGGCELRRGVHQTRFTVSTHGNGVHVTSDVATDAHVEGTWSHIDLIGGEQIAANRQIEMEEFVVSPG